MIEYESEKYGYCPHGDQTRLICPKCGNGIFKSYPQSVRYDAKVWAYEHACTKCGHIIAIEVDREM